MKQKEFKNKLDKRKLHGQKTEEVWDAAYEWAEKENEENPESEIRWSWDCGLKLDYDGSVCRISSRFYPPHKSSEEYGKYHGTISVIINNNSIHDYDVEAETLDELRKIVVEYVSGILKRIESKIKEIL